MQIEFPELHEEAFGENELNLYQEDVSIDMPENLKLLEVLQHMAIEEDAPLRELNYIFCSDEYLLDINTQHLQHDYYTDVITFPHLTQAICGDIFISVERVKENALKLKVHFDTELLRVMLHGALHLAGYTDETDEKKHEMRIKEDYYLRWFGAN